MISHLREEMSTKYFTPSTPLGSIITQRQIIGSSHPDKLLDPPIVTICTFTNDNEALHKVSSLYD
jgi:hypothetical protein